MKIIFSAEILFLKIFIIFEILKIRDSSLIALFILNLLLKAVRFYLFSCLRDNDPANPYFCLKPEKHDVTLTSFVFDVWEVTTFPFVRMCQIDGLEGIGNLVMVRLKLREMSRKNEMGRGKNSPPVSRGLSEERK